jgi:hypothetical protein
VSAMAEVPLCAPRAVGGQVGAPIGGEQEKWIQVSQSEGEERQEHA